jgi:hypothetical protein
MSVLLETPSDMHRIATRIRFAADDVRDRARRLTLAVEATHWHSPAARVFRSEVASTARQLCSVAERLDHAAHSLDRHAQHVHDIVTAPVHAVRRLAHTVGL